MLPELSPLRELVRDVAREQLLPRFADVQRHIKLDGSVVTAVDHSMQDRMQASLARLWPQYDFIGEEMPGDEHARLAVASERGLWCLDPLDGTSNYAAGVPFFAVSLALVVRGNVEIGVVYDPVRDECFLAQKGRGAWLNDTVLDVGRGTFPQELPRCIAGIDFKRLHPALAERLIIGRPYGSQRNFGACSLEWCWLADGRLHLYLHGGQKLWDFSAGSLILAEANGVATTLEGESVFALGLEPRSVVGAVDRDLFAAWSGWIARNWPADARY